MSDWKDYLHPVNGLPFMVEEWPPGNQSGPYYTLAACVGIFAAIAAFEEELAKRRGRHLLIRQRARVIRDSERPQ
jgi:hypothetical protein